MSTVASRLVAAATLALTLGTSPAAPAVGGDLEAFVSPIGEATERAESGDIVTVEGRIVSRESGQGNLTLFEIEDGTGSVLVAVSERQIRELRDVGASPKGHWVRVQGKWDHAYMRRDQWGIRAQRVEKLDR